MAFRAFYALPDSMATSTGQVTNAVFGFASMLARLIQNEAPTHVAVAFDVSRTSFRTARFPDYKATRGETPEAFKGQVPLIKEVLAALRINVFELDNFEADDLIATLATSGADAGMEVLICSGDRDTIQLVNEHVTLLYPIKGVSEMARYTPAEVEAKYSLSPVMYSDMAALVGETSDNLPGVPGVGPKTAVKWLIQYGGLEPLLARAGEIKGKVGESLRASVEQVRLNRALNALVTDLELPISVDDCALKPFDREVLHHLVDVLQFGRLRSVLLALDPGGAGGIADADDDVDNPDAPGGFAGAERVEVRVDTLQPGGLADWLHARADQPLGVVVAGRGTPAGGDAWGVAIANAVSGVYLDLTEIGSEDDIALANWLADPVAIKVLHAAKPAWHALAARGVELNGIGFDTELAAYLCYPDQRGYDLNGLVLRHLGFELEGDENTDQGAFDLSGAGNAEVARAAAILELAEALSGQLCDREASGLLKELELPLQMVLARMEATGIAVNLNLVDELERGFAQRVSAAADEAYAAIGREVNLGSPKQLQEVLFTELKLPKTKKTKTGYTTDAAALAHLYASTSPDSVAGRFIGALLAHRDQAKLRVTVEGLRKAVGGDGRIHTTFQQTIAATGRLSSTDPNLQNIPIRTEAGRAIRDAFVVGVGFDTLVTADYSQIEMRIMAHLSGDEGLITALNSGEDLHRYVGSRVYGVEPAAVTPEMRTKVKAMSFGLVYGLSAFGLSQQLGISAGEAQSLMDDYFARFGAVREYLEQVVRNARSTGYTATLLGRRRYLPDLTSDNRQRREMAERMALNAPIQGSAADIIKLAMLRVDRQLRQEGLRSQMLLQVHDELVVETAPGEREQVEQILVEQMAAAYELKVPLDVSVGVGATWLAAGH